MGKSVVSRQRPTSSQFEQGDPTRSNVTLPFPFDEDWFPCPLCQGLVAVKSSKRGKPYVVCDLCGVQPFVRKLEGIRRLRLILSSGQAAGSMRLGRLLEFYDYLTRRLDEVRKIINALREKKRELQAHGQRKSK
jgi:hypothetical protein